MRKHAKLAKQRRISPIARCDGDFGKLYWTEHDRRQKLYNTLSPSDSGWIAFASGKPGLSFETTIAQHSATAQLVIDRGKDADAENRSILEQLKSHKAEIEQKFGGPLEWYQRDGVRLCRIIHEVTVGGRRSGLRYRMRLLLRW